MMDCKALVDKAITRLHLIFRENPYLFLSESDIKCKFYQLLSEDDYLSKPEEIVDDFCWGPKKNLTLVKLKTNRLHSEFLTIREKFDLVIVEPEDIRLARNSKGKIGHFQLKEGKAFKVIIEIKSSGTSRSARSKSNLLSEIKKDVKKFNNFNFLSGFCLIFDFHNYLKEEDIFQLKRLNEKVEIIVFKTNHVMA